MIILLISGKRKSGKDFLSERLVERLGDGKAEIVRISEPIKWEWANRLNLNLKELLGSSAYKEKYRKEMIDWSEEVRTKDYGYFCRKAMKYKNARICIVSDVRRKSDIQYFKETYDLVKTIRIECPSEIRETRGWVNTVGVDDTPSECGLDDYSEWDLIIQNDNKVDIESSITTIFNKFSLNLYF